MSGRVKIRAWQAIGVAALLSAAPASIAQAQVKQPKLRARPHAAMVNSDVTLIGSGFPANASVRLAECGRTFWLDPAEPCNTANALTVQTDAKGRFTTSFDLELCPEGEPGKRPTERICYVGKSVSGEDTGALEPAAKVKVSYP